MQSTVEKGLSNEESKQPENEYTFGTDLSVYHTTCSAGYKKGKKRKICKIGVKELLDNTVASIRILNV